MNARELYNAWLNRSDLTDDERQALLDMEDDDLAITKAFGALLSFGTAGLRGIMGPGTNCLNRFTISWATAGIAEWLLDSGKAGATVVISTDSRLNHTLFAQTTALILHQYGFKVLLWKNPMPTPMLSWSVRHFGAASGIMITASHNPSNYNGYKAYDANGCQLLSEDANRVTTFADAYFEGKELTVTGDFDTLVASGEIRILDAEFSDYLSTVEGFVAPLQVSKGTPLTVGFTPLHGVGGRPVKTALEDAGYTVLPVESQFAPDGSFPTIATPNPELPVAFNELYKLAAEKSCDILIATDPDCDRIGVAAKDQNGEWQLISGNQLGALLIDFIAEARGVKPGDTIVTSTVTSLFGKETARYYGYDLVETFTGFKYIGNSASDVIKDPARTFVFGYEESYGYLYGDHCRDKDAVVTSLLVCAMAQADKAQGRSVLDRLNALYEKVGACTDILINVTFDPIPGQEPISAQIMQALRQNPPADFAGETVTKRTDFSLGVDNRPKENVLQYQLANGSIVSFRPSGTEPKMKCYINARGNDLADSRAMAERIEKAFHTFTAHVKEGKAL